MRGSFPIVLIAITTPFAGAFESVSRFEEITAFFENASLQAAAALGVNTIAAVDVRETVNAGTNWATTCLWGSTVNAATFLYEPDPNGPALSHTTANFATAPDRHGSGGRWVTFVSLPRNKDALARFDDRGAVGLAGLVRLDPTWIRIIGFDPLPITLEDGYVSRVVLDLSGTGFTSDQVGAGRVVPDGATILAFLSIELGTLESQFPPIVDWFIYAPEPSSLLLLILPAATVVRRR